MKHKMPVPLAHGVKTLYNGITGIRRKTCITQKKYVQLALL